MNIRIREKLPVLLRIPVLSYLIVAIITFIFSNPERNYSNLKLITIKEFEYQFFGFLIVSLIILSFIKKINKEIISISICFTYLLFVFIFSINSPTLSLMIGSIIIAIPAVFYSISHIIKDKVKTLNIYNIVSFLNTLLFLGLILIYIINSNTIFPELPNINQSLLSHAEFIKYNRSTFLYLGISITALILTIYFFNNKNTQYLSSKKLKQAMIIIVVGLALYQLGYMISIAVNHVRTLATPSFDFGIFNQMFYYIRDGLGPMTTLERNQLLSHFSVHMSPILYILYPVFHIFPYPETIQALQIIVVSVGIIPLFLITKHLKLNNIATTIILAIYIFHPAIIGSSFYDFHENCFLAPLLLFVIYYMMKQKMIGIIVSVVLTLLIKEDASIYLIFISLYFILAYPSIMNKDQSKLKNIGYSIAIITLSLAYFFIITNYLNTEGDGAMFWRYKNLNAYPDKGLIGVIISVFQNPSFLLATMFSPEKIYTILVIFLFMGLIPLLSRNIGDYILIAPLIVFNLASTYPYQHVLGFQYFYGTSVLLIFMMALVFKQRSQEVTINIKLKKINYIIAALSIIMITIFGQIYMYGKNYINTNYAKYYERNIEMKEFLLSIDEDKKVLATGYLTTYLGDVDILYDMQFYNLKNSDIEFDYILIDIRNKTDKIIKYQELALEEGYIESDLSTEYIMVYIPAQ